MVLDRQNQFSMEQALSVTAASTDIIDLGVDRDVGLGKALDIFMMIHTLFVTGDAATLQIALQTAIDAAFTSPIILMETPAIAVAALVAGAEPARWSVPSVTKRYLRLYYTVGTGSFSAGKINAGLVIDRQANRSYPSGIPAQS